MESVWTHIETITNGSILQHIITDINNRRSNTSDESTKIRIVLDALVSANTFNPNSTIIKSVKNAILNETKRFYDIASDTNVSTLNSSSLLSKVSYHLYYIIIDCFNDRE